jgi:Holliday junction resolvase-like predicted endonuclease
LRRAAEIWLARNPDCLELEIAFEVVGVRGKLVERVPLG